MRVFVTGATGFIGSSVVKDLLAAGHKVLGLARNEEKAAVMKKTGAEVLMGDLNDLAKLKAAAKECDGVAHLGFIHDFANYAASIQTDKEVVKAFGEALEGTNKPLVVTFGTAGVPLGKEATEDTGPVTDGHMSARATTELLVLDAAKRGVRASIMRLPPTVHGDGDGGFIAMLIDMAKKNGYAGYIGDGANRWPAVHRDDAARLYRLALEKAPAGTRLHAIAEEGIPFKKIAEEIAKGTNLEARSVTGDDIAKTFTWFAMFASIDNPVSATKTRATFDWTPKGPDLITDMRAHYFK